MMPRMLQIYEVIFFAGLILCVLALIDCLSTDEGDIRNLGKVYWVLIILFFPTIGSIAWFAAGRPVRPARRGQIWQQGSGFPEYQRPRGPRGPDDDPEFLASRMRREDEEMLSRWEADLRRREAKLRRADGGDDSAD
jgi:hypothetical protein